MSRESTRKPRRVWVEFYGSELIEAHTKRPRLTDKKYGDTQLLEYVEAWAVQSARDENAAELDDLRALKDAVDWCAANVVDVGFGVGGVRVHLDDQSGGASIGQGQTLVEAVAAVRKPVGS